MSRHEEALLREAAQALKAATADLPARVLSLIEERRKARARAERGAPSCRGWRRRQGGGRRRQGSGRREIPGARARQCPGQGIEEPRRRHEARDRLGRGGARRRRRRQGVAGGGRHGRHDRALQCGRSRQAWRRALGGKGGGGAPTWPRPAAPTQPRPTPPSPRSSARCRSARGALPPDDREGGWSRNSWARCSASTRR